jgi:hypothetical protein
LILHKETDQQKSSTRSPHEGSGGDASSIRQKFFPASSVKSGTARKKQNENTDGFIHV